MTSWGDKLTSYRGVSFTYDEIGNPLSYYSGTSYNFTWVQGRRLETVTKSGQTYTYTYNSDGIRTSKTVNGVTREYILNGTQILGELWSDGTTIVYIYDAEGSVIGMLYRTIDYAENEFDIFFYEKNIQGDIIAVYSADGTKLVNYIYDAWGNVSTTYTNGGASTGAQYNPFTYRGYYRDSETGFYYLNSRYYDPIIGRFINADSIEYLGTSQDFQSYNLFAYCSNNPIMGYDPLGTFNWGKFFKAVAAVVVAVAVVTVVAVTVVAAVGASAATITAVAVASVAGGTTAGGFNIANQIQEKGSDNLDWKEAGIAAGSGAARSAVSAVEKPVVSVIGDIVVSMIEGALTSAVKGEDVTRGMNEGGVASFSMFALRTAWHQCVCPIPVPKFGLSSLIPTIASEGLSGVMALGVRGE